jgi:hypothetical protein
LQILDVTDALIIMFCAVGSFFHSFIFLVARDVNSLFSVCILDMFNLSGLLVARSAISKLISHDHLGKAFGLLAAIHALVDALSAEYFWIYTATKDWHPGFIYCLNCLVHACLVLPLAYYLLKRIRGITMDEKKFETDMTLETVETDIRAIATT